MPQIHIDLRRDLPKVREQLEVSADRIAPRNGPPGVFHIRTDRFGKVREQYPHAAIIRCTEIGRYTVFGTVYDALPMEAKL